jgi:16S rRNA (cytosine1402-N4)-methyltransferase
VQHLPVMLEETVQALVRQENGIYIDCTFGRGGHSREILQQLGSGGKVLALDQDQDAIDSSYAHELRKDLRFELIHARFSELGQIIESKKLTGEIAGILVDLGVSSPQLDNPQRGFSFLKDGPLDMRMDVNAGISAAQWLVQVSEEELVRVLFKYGEERFARRIARAIIKQRSVAAIATTRQLAELIEDAVPVREKHKHPATRCFQAIRIEINRELGELEEVLDQALQALNTGGRLVVISFHSLEDRIVKRFIRDESRGKYTPGKLPIQNKDNKRGRLIKIGKPLRASKLEIEQNPRSRSAVLRIAERAG